MVSTNGASRFGNTWYRQWSVLWGMLEGMAEQYAATDKRTGLEVTVTGEFPPHPDDRVRIARTTTLFTRLMSTILATENETERRERFLAVETQLEMADALIREDMGEVQRLMRQTLEKMGITPDQMDDLAKQILEQLRQEPGEDGPAGESPPDDRPPEDGGPDRPPLPVN